MTASEPLRLGILGAARIAPMALIRPARRVGGVTVQAVAARDATRAGAFARRHGIPRVHGRYAALLGDPEVEAVYNPLPNSLHAAWTIRALEAGKHVLCEKPLAATAGEAEAMAEAATRAGRVLMEAFHYRYHALFARLQSILRAGELGAVRHLEASLCVPIVNRGDIRWRADLAGGALMDTGCYTVSLLRHLAEAEPEVRSARAIWTRGGVDRWLQAELRFPGDRTARLTCGLFTATLLRVGARVVGDRGWLGVVNWVAPQFFHRLRVVTPAGSRTERVAGAPSYDEQLRAFRAAVRDGEPPPTGPADAIANMRAIDAIYAAAGRPPPP